MASQLLLLLIDAIAQLSTEVFFVFSSAYIGKFIASMVFSLDLLIILLTFIVQKLASKHLTIKPMGDRLGYRLYYTRRQLDHLERVFRRGLAHERHHAGAGPLLGGRP